MSEHHDGHGHHWAPPSEIEARVRALESLLIEKGLVEPAAIDELISTFENDLGPMNGAKVVAKSWVDSDYKRRLLENGGSAVAELGFSGLRAEHLVAVENTPSTHNLVVCTLCSCYPWALLGLPPSWYKSSQYRSRAVIEPRSVLGEFGVELEEEIQIRVWDSSADIRYLVIPERPPGTEYMGESELAPLVTRDSMIGVGQALIPSPAEKG